MGLVVPLKSVITLLPLLLSIPFFFFFLLAGGVGKIGSAIPAALACASHTVMGQTDECRGRACSRPRRGV